MEKNNHSSKIEEMQDVIISAIAQTMVIYGVSVSVGRIYGVLYFSDVPMTIDEIKDEVAMSKASVSNGLRELLEIEMVSKVWKKGERKDHFIAEKDFIRNLLTFLVKNLRQERTLLYKAIEQAKPVFDRISNDTSIDEKFREQAKQNLKYIAETEDYMDWTMRFSNAMETGDIFTFISKEKEEE
ncbi:GbsR/MarR family transcriptional regulator [Pueribacillus sp. YX66]|uniref:GbsR/MarR family transcriptional regulator n=1 Tax=Pueribacillus sp. YX66 TaxID=3229242 RepID=UPI00358D719B